MTTVGEKTYSEFSRQLRNYMDDQDIQGPTHLFEKLRLSMAGRAPSLSLCKMAYGGKRILPPHVVLFMKESMSWSQLRAKHCLPDTNRNDQVVKHNNQLFFAARGLR